VRFISLQQIQSRRTLYQISYSHFKQQPGAMGSRERERQSCQYGLNFQRTADCLRSTTGSHDVSAGGVSLLNVRNWFHADTADRPWRLHCTESPWRL